MGLIVAAAAAYGYQRFSKMTPEQKTDLKKRGKDLWNKGVTDVKNMFGKKTTPEPVSEYNAPPY